MVGDSRRGGCDTDGSAGNRGNQVERGSDSKRAKNRKGRRGGTGGFGYGGRSELDVAIKDMLNDVEEAIQGMLQEYDGIRKESPAFIKPFIEGTLHKHEAAIKSMMEKHKPAINAILEMKGTPDDEYMVKIEHLLEEFEVAISKHLSCEYLLSLLCKTVAEQMEIIMEMLGGKAH